MDTDYWHRQDPDNPLYQDLIWSRPENKNLAGKLAIIGGDAQGFAAVGDAFNAADVAGIGTCRVILPDVLERTVSRVFPAAEFAPSTPSGSFAKQALAELLGLSTWADGVLVAGDMGRNSETAIVLEQFAEKHNGQLTITKDAADYFIESPNSVLNRENTAMVITMAQAQKLFTAAKQASAITFNMDVVRLIEALHRMTLEYPLTLVIKHLGTVFVAVNGQVSSTKLKQDEKIWRVKTAAKTSVWWLQNPTKTFEAITSSITI
jgi:NAD(P)H-hydrate repair Nnr-like enzyme with NAD(P)H-hydrate dehydratase domain